MKNMKKVAILSLICIMAVLSLTACKKKKNWHEVGGPEAPKVEFAPGKKSGVQYSRGTESNPAKVYLATIYVPTGRDEKGESQYKTIMYEMEELTPEGLHEALVACDVITDDCLFIDFTMEKSDEVQEMGPGAVGAKRDMEGTVRYVELDSIYENADEYMEANGGNYPTGKNMKGLIDMDDIYGAVLNTFAENYQLVNCYYQPGNMKDYREAHGIK